MFVAYQKNTAVLYAKNRADLEKCPALVFDDIKETDDDIQKIDNEIVIGCEALTAKKKIVMRKTRDEYLEKYVDPYQLPLRWNDLTKGERQRITDYRRYLLDVPQSANFPNEAVKTFDEWK